MECKADLHIHTTASDGALSPTEVVEIASEIGLGAIAITDHDTTNGIDEALAAGKSYKLTVVPGVEISTIHNEKTEIHILGYFFDHHNQAFLEQMNILKNARWNRGKEIVDKLNAIGISVSFERVIEIAGGGAIGRPHIARALCETGAAKSIGTAFGKYLVEGCPGFVPRYKISPFDAVSLIRNAGGVAGCAHVAKLKDDGLVVELINHGLAAIEAYHPDHGSTSRKFYRRFAAKRGLIATGGSDSHCLESKGIDCGIGSVTVTCDVVDKLREAATQK